MEHRLLHFSGEQIVHGRSPDLVQGGIVGFPGRGRFPGGHFPGGGLGLHVDRVGSGEVVPLGLVTARSGRR